MSTPSAGLGSGVTATAWLPYWRAAVARGSVTPPRLPSGSLLADRRPLEVSVSPRRTIARPGIAVHRRTQIADDEIEVVRGIAVSDPIRTLIDVAVTTGLDELENLLGAADRRDLLTPDAVVVRLDEVGDGPGVTRLRTAVERRTLTLTDSHLERLMLPIARRAGLSRPLTQEWVNGYRVDFYFPDIGLVVETDGFKYHRTAARQTIDARRDQTHTAAGLTPLRFSHAQVAHQPRFVEEILRRTAQRLSGH